MTSIARGSKLVVRSGEIAVTVRSLRGVDITGPGWAVPVIADLAALKDLNGACTVDLTTDAGPVRVDAEIVATDGDLLVRAPQARPETAIRPAALTDQRRENVRGPLRLEFRGTVMAVVVQERRPHQKGLLAARGPGRDAHADLVGSTTSISAGGVRVDLEESVPLTPGTSLYGEITLPDGDLVPAVLLVVEQTRQGFRAEFTDISPFDSERLVRLVFSRERGGLAGRRR